MDTSIAEKNNVAYNLYMTFYILALFYYGSRFGQEVQAYGFISLVLFAMIITTLRINDRLLKTILLVGLAARFLLMVTEANISVSLLGPGADTGLFESAGWDNAVAWSTGVKAPKVDGPYYYSALIGLFYFVFGRQPLIIQFISVAIGFIVIHLTYNLTLLWAQRRSAAYLAATLVAVFPTLSLLSAVILREIHIIALILLSLLLFLEWLNRGEPVYFIASFVSSLLAGFLHGAMLLVGWIQFFYFSFYNSKSQKLKFFSHTTAVMAALILFLLILLSMDLISYKIPSLNDLLSIGYYQRLVVGRAISRTIYLEELVPNSFFDILWQTPIRVLYFIFTPFPWMINNIKDIYGFVESIFYLIMCFYSVIGFKEVYRRSSPSAISITMVVLTIIVMFAWGTVNYGTAWRHKAKIAPFLMIMASSGFVTSPRSQKLITMIGDYLKEE